MPGKSSGRGSAGLKLAPDLTYPGALSSGSEFVYVSSINASAGLTEILGLSGKWAINIVSLTGLTAEANRIQLTIDGQVIWDDTSSRTTYHLWGNPTTDYLYPPIICEQSFSLKVDTLTDTNIDISYHVVPLL